MVLRIIESMRGRRELYFRLSSSPENGSATSRRSVTTRKKSLVDQGASPLVLRNFTNAHTLASHHHELIHLCGVVIEHIGDSLEPDRQLGVLTKTENR